MAHAALLLPPYHQPPARAHAMPRGLSYYRERQLFRAQKAVTREASSSSRRICIAGRPGAQADDARGAAAPNAGLSALRRFCRRRHHHRAGHRSKYKTAHDDDGTRDSAAIAVRPAHNARMARVIRPRSATLTASQATGRYQFIYFTTVMLYLGLATRRRMLRHDLRLASAITYLTLH